MLKNIGLIALAILILISGSTAAAGTSTSTELYYYEDFSGYALGSFPSNWSIMESGAGKQRAAALPTSAATTYCWRNRKPTPAQC